MARLSVRNIEIVQAIQNASNDVPLVAGKRTYVRVYLNPAGIPDGARVSGYLSIRKAGRGKDRRKPPIYGASSGSVCQLQSMSLGEQRLDWSSSLNFQLPDTLLDQAAGGCIVAELESVTLSEPGADPVEVGDLQGNRESGPIEVVGDPDMHCRILMFRHRDANNRDFLRPRQGEVDAVKRYVESTFPVARVSWSSVEISAPRDFRALGRILRESKRTQEQLTSSYVSFFQHMMAIREQDIVHGRHARTLYLGLIFDPSGRFGGAAMDSPQFAAPHVVAMATPDTDGQLGAHELAHVLGRRHPGIPDSKFHGNKIGQREEPGARIDDSGKHPPSDNGFISGRIDEEAGITHIGLDNRVNASVPKLLPHDQWYDLMTYRHPKWVSDMTYVGLHGRLDEINRGDFGASAKDAIVEDVWTVIGEYDLGKKSGRIFYVTKGRYKTPMPDLPGAQTEAIKLAWEIDDPKRKAGPDASTDGNACAMATECVYVRNYKDLDGSPNLGVFQHSIGLSDDKLDVFRSIDGKPVKSAESRARFSESFRKLVAGDGRLDLMVKDRVVDQVRDISDGEKKRLKTYLERVVTPSGTYPVSDAEQERQSKFYLQYSINDGGYYLCFNWGWEDTLDCSKLCVVTSLACKRKAQQCEEGKLPAGGEPQWETIAIHHRQGDRAWISPVFFDDPCDNKGDRDKHEEKFAGGAKTTNQSLMLKISLHVGFRTISTEVEMQFPSRVKSAIDHHRGNDASYVSGPGSSTQSKHRGRYYR